MGEALTELAEMTAVLTAANDVDYIVKARPSQLALLASRSLVKASVLVDSRTSGSGPIQVLIPASHLLELDVLNRHFDADFRGLTEEESQKLFGVESQHIPAVPCWRDMRCIVHKSLLDQSKLLLDTGSQQKKLIELDQANFKLLVSHCETMDLACAAPRGQADPKHDEQDILNSVKQFTERRIHQRLSETLELPPLPQSAARVIELRAKREPEIDELTNIVESDPSLAAQVVSWASSPYYSAPGAIKSVHDAIVRVLGFDMVLNLALGLSLSRSLKLSHITAKELNSYWRHAMLLATTSEVLAQGLPSDQRPQRGELYLSGLLANLGYLVLAEVFPLYFQQVKRHCQANRHLPTQVLERFVLGIDNNQVASWLLENWQMPSAYVATVRFANQWAYKGEQNLHCKLILCARHLLAKEQLVPNPGPNLTADMLDLLGIDSSFVEQKMDKIIQASKEFDTKLGY